MRKQKTAPVVEKPQNSVQLAQDQAKIEKQFAKMLNLQRKQADNLLGDFGENGYDISAEIKKQLVEVPKKFDRIENNIIYCATKLGEFVLNFKIEMDLSGMTSDAKLFIIEIEHGVEEDIKHTTLVDSLVEPYVLEFRKKVCEVWNVFYNDEMKEKNDALYAYLHMQNEEFMFNREPIEFLAHLYLVRMQEVLEKFGSKGVAIQNKYAELMKIYMQRNEGVEISDTIRKRLLDEAILATNLLPELLKKEEGLKVIGGVVNSLKDIHSKEYLPKITDAKTSQKEEKPAAKTEEKPAAKKKSAAKEKPKAKSGGSAPEKKKKDEEKKEIPNERTYPPSLATVTGIQTLGTTPFIPENVPGRQQQRPQQSTPTAAPKQPSPAPQPQAPKSEEDLSAMFKEEDHVGEVICQQARERVNEQFEELVVAQDKKWEVAQNQAKLDASGALNEEFNNEEVRTDVMERGK